MQMAKIFVLHFVLIQIFIPKVWDQAPGDADVLCSSRNKPAQEENVLMDSSHYIEPPLHGRWKTLAVSNNEVIANVSMVSI